MAVAHAIRDLQAFIDEKWSAAQPRFYPRAVDRPRVPAELTSTEAAYFLASVMPDGDEPPLLVVDDDRKQRSDRYPRLTDGSPRGYLFFEAPGRLRLETLVHWAALARLRCDFGWPREHLVCESPTVLEYGHEVLRYEALDILLLAEPRSELSAKMPLAAVRSLVGIEAKGSAEGLDGLVRGMRACQTNGAAHRTTDHVKCAAIAVLRPRFFLGIAAGETWRSFTVVERRGRAVLGAESRNLDHLRFSAMRGSMSS